MLDYRPDWYPEPWADQKILGTAHALIPTERGTYRPVTGNVQSTYSATLSDIPLAAFATTLTDGSFRNIIGSQTKLWEAAASSFTDRSALTYSATGTWWFAQLGDVTIATDYVDNVQSSSAGAFAALGGSPPKAKIVCVQSNIALLFNINDGSVRPDGYATSDIVGLGGTPNVWTVAATNECKRGRFTETPGPITNACTFRDGVLVFKRRGIWFGRYVGRPLIWRWELVSDKVGCASTNQGGAITAAETCYFGGDSKIFSYDGVSVRTISDGLNGNLAIFVYANQSSLRIHHLEEKSLLVFWWNVGGSDKMRAYTYNYASQKWGGRVTGAQWFPLTGTPTNIIPVQCDFAQAAGLKTISAQITSFAVNGTGTAYYLDSYDHVLGTGATATLDLPFIGSDDADAEISGITLLMIGGGFNSGATLSVNQGKRNMLDTCREGFWATNITGTVTGKYNGPRRRFDCKAAASFLISRMTLPSGGAGYEPVANSVTYYLWELADIAVTPQPKAAGRS